MWWTITKDWINIFILDEGINCKSWRLKIDLKKKKKKPKLRKVYFKLKYIKNNNHKVKLIITKINLGWGETHLT